MKIGVIADTHGLMRGEALDEIVGGVRYFNPARAGPRRFDYPMSIGVIEDGNARHIALDERSIAALDKRMNQLSR
jgi:predicted phosphodiesterase